MKGDMAAALRGGTIVTIPADDLRIGDLVLIQTGDTIPADLTLLEASDLEVDEFDLTGELLPVLKCVTPGHEVRVFHGTNVLRGHGKGAVIAAGENTEYGRILAESRRHARPAPVPLISPRHIPLLLLFLPALLIRLTYYDDHTLTYLTYPPLAFLLLLLQNTTLLNSLVVQRLQKKLVNRNIFFRHEGVFDEIQHVDTFCFDKTGVVTTRDMKVKGIYLGGENCLLNRVTDPDTWDIVLTGCALCHDRAYRQTIALANPVDRALISFAQDNGIHIDDSRCQYRRIYHKPFNSEDRYMACGFDHSYSGTQIYFAKGDPEVLLMRCDSYVTPLGERKPTHVPFLLAVRAQMEKMSHEGSVVIALAYRENSIVKPPSTYTFLCLLRLENPLQPGANTLLQKLSEKGIRNVILTGDRTETALRIGVETGIEDDEEFYLTGRDIEKMPLSDIALQSEYISVFTRLSPSQKGIVVRSFQQRGHKVVMIGDGTNDVIAVKSADVGISFAEGSSPMAKRAAKVLINELADIRAVMEMARHAHWQVQVIAVCMTLVFLMLLLGPYLFTP